MYSIRSARPAVSRPTAPRSFRSVRSRPIDVGTKAAMSISGPGNSENGFFAPVQTRQPSNPDYELINKDFAPTTEEKRIFGAVDLAALWVGLVVCLPTYYLAGGLVEMGMSWWQGILTVLVGNVITLVPMILNAHPGTKYGVPFPVLARSSFGILGANIPSMMRALVACGWFGIQTFVGAQCLHKMATIFMGPAMTAMVDFPIQALGISSLELFMFVAFWAAQVAIILKGIESIKEVEKWSAPVLIFLSIALLAWAYNAAGGFGPMLSAPSQFGPGMPLEGKFWQTFIPAVTANVGFWATLSLNIPDFTRYAKSQKDQVIGQTVGLPLFMAAFTFVGLAVTSSTIVMYGQAISDPIQLLGKIEGLVPILVAELGLLIATLSTNIAANVVAPANAIVNLAPKNISFTTGGLIAATIGLLIQPWKLISSSQGFMNWLIGYSVVMGPIAGILVADYFLVRNRELDIDDLYKSTPERGSDRLSKYWFTNGINWRAPLCLVAGILPSLPGLLVNVGVLSAAAVPTIFTQLYNFSWFIGFGVGCGLYYMLMQDVKRAEEEARTMQLAAATSVGSDSPDSGSDASSSSSGVFMAKPLIVMSMAASDSNDSSSSASNSDSQADDAPSTPNKPEEPKKSEEEKVELGDFSADPYFDRPRPAAPIVPDSTVQPGGYAPESIKPFVTPDDPISLFSGKEYEVWPPLPEVTTTTPPESGFMDLFKASAASVEPTPAAPSTPTTGGLPNWRGFAMKGDDYIDSFFDDDAGGSAVPVPRKRM